MAAQEHPPAQETSIAPPLGIVAALPEEVRHLGAALVVDDKVVRGGFSFRVGRLDGAPVVLVEAGIGKVNTALVAALLLDRFACGVLLFTGVAGGLDPSVGIGDVIIADRLIQHDYGAIAAGHLRNYRPGVPPLGPARDDIDYRLQDGLRQRIAARLAGFVLPELPASVTGGSARVPSIGFGTILSGDQFINCEATRRRLFDRFGASAVEMEGAALAQVAGHFGAPCVVIRSASDLAGGNGHVDFAAFLAISAEVAARVVRRLVPVLSPPRDR